MNYKRMFQKFIDAGYLDAPDGSKLARVGLKVARRQNRQALYGNSLKVPEKPKRDPVWLSAHMM